MKNKSHRDGPVGDDVAKRLARIAGHATSLKKFWDEGRHCDDMLTQIAAVNSALDQVGRIIIENHFEQSFMEAAESGRTEEVVRELKKSLRRLV